MTYRAHKLSKKQLCDRPSSRHPENLKGMAARSVLAQAGPVEQAIALGDVVVMVVLYAALEGSGRRTAGPR